MKTAKKIKLSKARQITRILTKKTDKMIIHLRNITKIYKVGVESIHALDGIDLESGYAGVSGT